MTLKRYTVKQILDNSMNNNVPPPWCYLAADVDAHLKEVEDAHKNQLSHMTDTQAYMEDRAHMEQENENLHFELSALKEQHENEDKNEYRPWESEGITELAYWKKRYLELRHELAETEACMFHAENVSRPLCIHHPHVDYRKAWGCPVCVAELRAESSAAHDRGWNEAIGEIEKASASYNVTAFDVVPEWDGEPKQVQFDWMGWLASLRKPDQQKEE